MHPGVLGKPTGWKWWWFPHFWDVWKEIKNMLYIIYTILYNICYTSASGRRSFSLEDCFGIKWHEYNHSQCVLVGVWIEFVYLYSTACFSHGCLAFPWCRFSWLLSSQQLLAAFVALDAAGMSPEKVLSLIVLVVFPLACQKSVMVASRSKKCSQRRSPKFSWFIEIPLTSSDHQQLSLSFLCKTSLATVAGEHPNKRIYHLHPEWVP